MTMPGRSYNAGSGYRYGFNGQEKNDEIFEGSTTALFWEYDSRIGRRWNKDPEPRIWESSYSTFGGNPILNSDVKGNFWFTDHMEIDRIAYQKVFGGIAGTGVTVLKVFKTLWIELALAKNNSSHLDNMTNAEMSKSLTNGDYSKWDSHQVQDFYSHSNYVEILNENGVDAKDMVTFDKLDKGSDLYKDVMSKIQTTTFPHEKNEVIKPNNHDGGDGVTYEQLANGKKEVPLSSSNFMAKDANGGSKGFFGKVLKFFGIDKYKGFKHPLHDAAKKLATDATIKKIRRS